MNKKDNTALAGKTEKEEIHKGIVNLLKMALTILDAVSEKCSTHKMWDLGPCLSLEKIEDVIYQLRYIVNRADSVAPDTSNKRLDRR